MRKVGKGGGKRREGEGGGRGAAKIEGFGKGCVKRCRFEGWSVKE